MTKLTKEEIEILNNVSIHGLLGLSKRRQFVRCPFHNERTPSCMIYDNNSFKCYGCGEHGKGAISFLTKCGMSFVDACLELSHHIK